MTDLTLRQFQTNLPWTIRYSNDFRSSSMSHKDFAHTLHHVSKAAGKLHGLADDMDHDRALADDPTLRAQYEGYIADLVICALRLSNTFPGGVVDLQSVVHKRIEEKNNVVLNVYPVLKSPGVSLSIKDQSDELLVPKPPTPANLEA